MSGQNRWLISARFDLAFVILPMLAAVVTLLVIRGFGVKEPLWAYLLFFVSFDVAHVWGTIYLTYMDKEAFARHRRLLLWIVPACFLGVFGFHMVSSTAFWTALSYFAIYHFAKQQYGFIAIYKARARERQKLDYYLDKGSLWVGALGPVLLWHSAPKDTFDWFGSGEEFLFQLPEAFHFPIYAVMGAVGLAWLGRQVQVFVAHRHFNAGKFAWMVASWISWYVGVLLSDHLFVSAAFLNLFHGIPYMILVWRRCNVRWEGKEKSKRWVAWLSQRRRWWIFYGFVLFIAMVEEFFWDGIVWKKYIPELIGWEGMELGAVGLAFWVALLSLPQVVHYFLDGVLWKMNDSNPDLREMFKA